MKRLTILLAAALVAAAPAWAAVLNVPGAYATIQAAINAANPGDTIQVAAGTYTENITIDRRVQIIGAGNTAGGTVLKKAAAAPVVTLTGSGVAGSPILLQNLMIKAEQVQGIRVFDGVSVAYVTLDRVRVIGTNETNDTENEIGLRVDTTANLSHLVLNACAFDHLTYGWYFFKHGDWGPGGSLVSDVTVTDTSFSYNDAKGIYVEKLTNASFSRCTVHNNGVNQTFYNKAWNAGFDINLKGQENYVGIALECCTFTSNGLGVKEGAALMIKARGSGTDGGGGGAYQLHPAALSLVTIAGGTITGNERGIRIGEPGQANTSPTMIQITDAGLYGNAKTYAGTDGSAYGDLIDMRGATVDAINAQGNWWGQAGGPVAGQVYDAVAAAPLTGAPLAAPSTLCTPTLTLASDQTCYRVNDDVIVNVELADAATEIVGGQFWLEYDASKLSYTPGGGNPLAVAPWSVLVFTQHAAPVIFLSVGIPDGGLGAQSGPMAQLKFKAVAEGCNVADAVRFKSPDGTPPTRLGDRYDNVIYPTKVNLAAITIDSTPPVITCTDITTTADPGQCSAAFVETFDDPVALCPAGAPQCWQIDRKAPAIFTNGTLGGENVLHHGIRAADFVGCGNFYATQGRSYPLDMPVGTVLAVDVYIPADYATNLRNVGLWGVTYDSYPQVSGYPILSYASTNPANGCDPTPSSPRFRYFTQDIDQDASNGYQAGYVTMMPVTVFDAWYRLEIELTNISYIFRVKDADGVVLATATDIVTFGSVRFGRVILQGYNFGADYDIFWDNLTTGPKGPMVTDNCGYYVNTTLVGTRSDSLPLSDPYPVGTTTITWTATDCSGNTAGCVQTITVTDDEDPVISCPADINVANDPGLCSATVNPLMPPGWTLEDQASIVAGPPGNPHVLRLASLSADTPPWGSAVYVPPTPMTFNDVTALGCDYSMVTGCFGGGSPRFALGIDTNNDNTVDGHVFVYLGSLPNYVDCPTLGQWFSTGNLITAGDERFDLTQLGGPFYGTHAEAVALVGTKPVKYVILSLDGSWMYDQVMLVDNIVVGSNTFRFGPTATDNCGIASIVGTRSDSQPLSAPYPVGTTTITWTATDVHGRTATCTQTVTVTDAEDPVITCSANINVANDPGLCSATVTITPATATDNCGIASIVGTRSDSQPLSAPYPVGTTTITWTATDVHGRTATCPQTVTVNDTEPPAITCPANGTIECDGVTLWLGTATGGVLVVYNNNGPENPGNQAFFRGQFSQANTAGALFNFNPGPGGYGPSHPFQVVPDQFGFDFTLPAPTYNGTNPPLTWFTAVDNVDGTCAGAASVGPVAWALSGYTPTIPNAGACPVNSLFRSNGLDPSSVALTQWNVTATPPTFTADIAGRVVTDGLVHWYTPALPDTPLSALGFGPAFTFAGRLTYDSTGDPGNDGDFYAGTIEFFAQQLTLVNGSATATDNCTAPGSIVITYTDVFAPGGCGHTGTITRTWKATDQYGNYSTCNQTITVVDTTAPTFVPEPADVSVNADAGGCTATLVPPMAMATAVDNCDPTPTVTFVRSDGQPTLTAPYSAGVTTITWTATDCTGNSQQTTTYVTVDPVNELVVDLELRGVTSGPFDRCITFELDPGNVTVQQVVTFTANAGGSRADNVLVLVPITCPGFTGFNCIRARDALHTLWAAQTPGEGFGTAGTQYVADFTNDGSADNRLVVGNLNGDPWIDVLDFAIYVVRFGTSQPVNLTCTYTAFHPDFDGTGLVDSADFTVIQTYFLYSDDTGCGTKSFGGRGPVTRISVEELKAQGLEELIPADLNGDGWLDTADMEAFAAGAMPARPGDLNADGVVNFEDIDAFVLALQGEAAYHAAYPQGRWLNGDLNGDGAVTFDDIDLLVQALQNR